MCPIHLTGSYSVNIMYDWYSLIFNIHYSGYLQYSIEMSISNDNDNRKLKANGINVSQYSIIPAIQSIHQAQSIQLINTSYPQSINYSLTGYSGRLFDIHSFILIHSRFDRHSFDRSFMIIRFIHSFIHSIDSRLYSFDVRLKKIHF